SKSLCVSDKPPPQFVLEYRFSDSRTHRDQRTFPTRRSSDLTPRPPRWRAPTPTSIVATCSRRSGGGTIRAGRCPFRSCPMPTPRSEEHTSELQSRENLVCRLLLEKKKIRTKVHVSEREM